RPVAAARAPAPSRAAPRAHRGGEGRSRVKRGLVCVVALSSLLACDKLGIGNKNADGGTATADPASGGGIPSLLDSKFEGDITMQVSKPRENPKSFTFELKPPKFRIEAPPEVAGNAANNPMTAGGLSLILDTPAKKAYALIHAKKQAMVIDFAQI